MNATKAGINSVKLQKCLTEGGGVLLIFFHAVWVQRICHHGDRVYQHVINYTITYYILKL